MEKYTFFTMDFPTRKRLLLCFKRVVLGSCKSGFLLVHEMVMGHQFSSRAQCLLGRWKAARLYNWAPESLSKTRTQSFAQDGRGSLERGRLAAWQEKPPCQLSSWRALLRGAQGEAGSSLISCAVLYDRVLCIPARLAVV